MGELELGESVGSGGPRGMVEHLQVKGPRPSEDLSEDNLFLAQTRLAGHMKTSLLRSVVRLWHDSFQKHKTLDKYLGRYIREAIHAP